MTPLGLHLLHEPNEMVGQPQLFAWEPLLRAHALDHDIPATPPFITLKERHRRAHGWFTFCERDDTV